MHINQQFGSISSNYTTEEKQVKEFQIKATGCKQWITVMMGITTDGYKLPPF